MPEDAPGNPGAVPEWADEESGEPDDELVMLGKVRGMRARLHRWAGEDSSRRLGDLFNLAAPRKRLVISPAKPGGTQREVSGLDG
jgi:hypothetical protein